MGDLKNLTEEQRIKILEGQEKKIQKQQAEIDDLKAEIKELKKGKAEPGPGDDSIFKDYL